MKICALLVPREMKVEHSGGVKAMSDEEIEQTIAAIRAMLDVRADDAAKVYNLAFHLLLGRVYDDKDVQERIVRSSKLQLTGAFAEFERTMIRQRIKAGLKRAVAQGVKLGWPKIDGATERKVRRDALGPRRGTFVLGISLMPPLPKTCPKMVSAPQKGVAFLTEDVFEKNFQLRERIPLSALAPARRAAAASEPKAPHAH